MASCPCLERIEPTQPRKAAKVAVVGMNHRLVFDGEGRDVGIGDQGAAEHAGIAEAREDGQMARTWLQDPHARLIKPRTQMVQRGCHRHRALQHRSVGHHPEKTKGDNPREGDGLGAGDEVFPPNLGLLMVGRVGVVGVDEQI